MKAQASDVMTDAHEAQPLRVAMVAACPFPHPRGTPVRICRMAEALAQRGHEVHVVTYHLGQATDGLPFVIHRIRRVPTYRKLDPGPSYQKLAVVDPLLSHKLAHVVRRHAIDVIHAHHYEGLLVSLPVRWRFDIPVVYDAHIVLDAELHHYGLGLMRQMKKRIAGVLDGQLPRRADRIIAVTEEIARVLVQRCGVPPDHVTAIVNGVECEHFDVPRSRRNSNDRPTVVFAGNLARYQGIEPMLHAFAKLRVNGHRAARLLVASDDSLEPYASLIERLGIRDAIDHEPSPFDVLPKQLARGDVGVNPRSECAGIPQKLLNYMAAGLPVVSFAGSAKGVVDGESGRVVPDGDVDSFAAAMASLIANPVEARRIGECARRHVRERHSWSGVAKQTEAVYQQVLEARAARAHSATGDRSLVG